MPEYELIRSHRRTVSLSISKDLKAVVRAPMNMPLNAINSFVSKHSAWIERHRELVKNRSEPVMTPDEAKALRQKAQMLLPKRVEHFEGIMGVKAQGVKITSASTRWGSCSAKNCLCFSYRLMLLPPDIIDYIVVHELAHINVKNHSAKFYDEVAQYMPNYKELQNALKRLQLG